MTEIIKNDVALGGLSSIIILVVIYYEILLYAEFYTKQT